MGLISLLKGLNIQATTECFELPMHFLYKEETNGVIETFHKRTKATRDLRGGGGMHRPEKNDRVISLDNYKCAEHHWCRVQLAFSTKLGEGTYEVRRPDSDTRIMVFEVDAIGRTSLLALGNPAM